MGIKQNARRVGARLDPGACSVGQDGHYTIPPRPGRRPGHQQQRTVAATSYLTHRFHRSSTLRLNIPFNQTAFTIYVGLVGCCLLILKMIESGGILYVVAFILLAQCSVSIL